MTYFTLNNSYRVDKKTTKVVVDRRFEDKHKILFIVFQFQLFRPHN